MCEQRGAEAYFPPPEYCMDNGAMIAHQGLVQLKNGDEGLKTEDSKVDPDWRPYQVDVHWQ